MNRNEKISSYQQQTYRYWAKSLPLHYLHPQPLPDSGLQLRIEIKTLTFTILLSHVLKRDIEQDK